MTRDDLIAGLQVLNAPDKGMNYHGGGIVDGPRFDERTGERLPPRYKEAEITLHGERARFIYSLIENAPALAEALRAPSREPEGRAVATWHPIDENGSAEVRVNGKRITSMPSYPGAQEVAERINAALATREEAPAEAGPVCLEIPLSNHMRVTLEYGPDGSRTATLWNEANEPIADGDAPSLRAQPPAREDAQPVAWRGRDLDAFGDGAWAVCSFKPSCDVVEPLYTHPAPDALRVAVGAYLTAVDDLETPVMSPSLGLHRKEVASQARGKLREALAALQAEQKGGA